tara:strand:+ start:31 stop:402 length:372 start_codon:yes stop_codon:yes gene_type:complete
MGINSTEVSYGFGQMGSILITGTTNAVTIIGGRDSDATPAGNTNRTTKVFVAIQFLEDTVFDNAGLTSEDNTMFPNDTVASTGIDANGGAVTDGVTFPKGLVIYGRWTSILLDSGKCIAYIGY